MNRSTRRGRFAGVSLAVAASLLAASPLAAQAMDDVVRDYSQVSSAWLTHIQGVALGLFATLAVIELAITGIRLALDHSGSVLGPLLTRFLLLAFGFVLLSQFPLWLPRITQGFADAGKAASGTTALSPSTVLDVGIRLCSNILTSLGSAGLLANPAGNLVGALLSLIVLLIFALIAAQLVLVLVESYIVLSAGILFLGFGASRITAPLAERYFLYAVDVGIRLFFLYVLVAVAPALEGPWVAALRGGSIFPFNLRPFLEVLGGSLAFGFVVMRIPSHIAARMTAGVSFGLTEALRSQ
jgi:type IV secretion system protein TrbL